MDLEEGMYSELLYKSAFYKDWHKMQKYDIPTHNRIGIHFSLKINVYKIIMLLATRPCLWCRKDHNRMKDVDEPLDISLY